MTARGIETPIEDESRFLARVAQEWRRAERSSRPALLILFKGMQNANGWRDQLIEGIGLTIRDTDVAGWFETNVTFGVICVELGKSDVNEASAVIVRKIASRVFDGAYPPGLEVTGHILPPYTGTGPLNGDVAKFAEAVWKSSAQETRSARMCAVAKRILDIAVSALVLVILLPVLLVIAIAIRLTSAGPAIFHQTRVGLGGRPFELYKFRSMRVASDNSQHRQYVTNFIHGNAEKHLDGRGQSIYKLTQDPRITPFGKWLRGTSLDELPQLWNVLRGDMTLVGPRPPLSYELQSYGLWHRRRVFELKPGLTGLWQVRGRSRCNFDEMVRLDLQHRHLSLALYLRVLLETPRAVLSGGGAQ